MKHYVWLITILCFVGSCASTLQKFSHEVGPRNFNRNPLCNTAESYTYEYEYHGYFKGYEAVIHSQVELDETNFSATDIAELSWIIIQAAKDRFRGLDYWRYVALQKMFAHTHVIVTVDNDHLHAVWGSDPNSPLLARTTRSIYSCWEPVNNTWFYTIVKKSFNRIDPDTVVHEAMHIVGRVLFDDYNVKHNSVLLWDEHDKEYSLQKIVEDRWLNRHLELLSLL
jgi:hypothetical protein